jgi:hypothetical protein
VAEAGTLDQFDGAFATMTKGVKALLVSPTRNWALRAPGIPKHTATGFRPLYRRGALATVHSPGIAVEVAGPKVVREGLSLSGTDVRRN